jgi:hypothetical protein
MPRTVAVHLTSDQSQVRRQNSLAIESNLFVHGRQLARALGLAQTRNRKMGMKGALFAGKTCFFARSFQPLVKQAQTARGILNSDPEYPGLAIGWKCAAASDDQFEGLNQLGSALSRLRHQFNLCYGNIAKEFHGEVKVLFRNPTGSFVRNQNTQATDVLA